jgi:integrase
MIILWRRHIPGCPVKNREEMRECSCPIFKEWRVNGRRFRKSMKTKNYQKALSIIRQEELTGVKKTTTSPKVMDACDKYLLDTTARGLKEPTLYKFRLLFRQLQDFSAEQGIVFISDFNSDNVRSFRATWPNKNFAARKKLENLRAFFRFCHVSEWIGKDPTIGLKPGRIADTEITPITKEELKKILTACDKYPDKQHAIKLRALLLVMRYTGLRIRDVVTLRKDHINKGKLYLRTAKTGTDVYCPLPPNVLEALNAIPGEGKYFFWSGSSKPKSAVGDFQRSLRTLFDLAGTPRIHAHLFRHTYATELLTAGTSIETVAALLGHSSTKVTEKSYSHWVKGRQESLEAAVKNAWTHLDPLAAEPA